MKLFDPISNTCHDCGRLVAISDRQDIVIDEKGFCWRLCGQCKEREEVNKGDLRAQNRAV